MPAKLTAVPANSNFYKVMEGERQVGTLERTFGGNSRISGWGFTYGEFYSWANAHYYRSPREAFNVLIARHKALNAQQDHSPFGHLLSSQFTGDQIEEFSESTDTGPGADY